ncbi:HpcH/HpaI aldolase family protein [Martelella radicis]|uniref:2-keto-3-deoxy-L-rhamnonate aldolase RhmA n=1 Tax=Martelella radicis TaxID=1397476 RepID=A0A7W6PAE7_9HYPH|nr:aldolase/citrate lyase family protein [Martelella radicis]MBB4123262.1 2-keto-3-deoxy-L-rhamnonate aldolase RhmA [Martelella radicis]
MTRKSPEAAAIGLAICVMGTVETVAVARRTGFDFLVVDMEHGRIGLDQMTDICVAGLLAGLPVYARVTGPASPDIARVLDCGATGVIVPHVDTLQQAEAIVEKTRFLPTGSRALPGPLAITGFEPVPVAELVDKAEASTQVIAMVESLSGLEAAEQIATLDGIDGLMIGSNDLAAALGCPGDIANDAVVEAFAAIGRAAKRKGKTFGVMGLPPERVREQALDFGARMIVATNEINLLFEGAQRTLGDFRKITERG